MVKNSIKYQCAAEWNKSITEINNFFLAKYRDSLYYKSFFDLNKNQFKKLVNKILQSL